MEWLLAVLVVLALTGVALAAAGRGGSMPTAGHDRPDPGLPDRHLTGDDVRAAQFSVAPRGYRMDEVDALLDRLAAQLDDDPRGHGGDGQ